ncbi:LysR family transcriptional regulator [Actinomadura xylanilytica]|uniref:LysR substrate-binding domain-containing protein n=1 Tax=Actinomadura xylanilytica TaxID=887459 RepID=UPI00255A7355|nr:LysR family transcriptional regulator [Actinomadura xylanilytica]MDL4774032.1 LysR family transcriptional regulator [Actinomadura xylanilytica]
MELRQLASFLAVVEEGQFAKAAARLFLSPPAVTAHVRQLERELGVDLLERFPLRLTAAGERLVPHAREALKAVRAATDSAADPAADLKDGPRPLLRIGVMGHGSAELTPAIVRAYRRARPETRLVVESLDFTEHVSALVRHRVDVAFVRPAPGDERVEVDVLTTEPRIVGVSAASAVAEDGTARLADVLDLPYVKVPGCTPQVFKDYLYFATARGGERPRRGVDQARNPQEVLLSIAAGRGVSSALWSFARFYPWPGVRYVTIADAPWDDSVLATRRGDPRPEIAAFRALAVTMARELGPVLLPPPPASPPPAPLELPAPSGSAAPPAPARAAVPKSFAGHRGGSIALSRE